MLEIDIDEIEKKYIINRDGTLTNRNRGNIVFGSRNTLGYNRFCFGKIYFLAHRVIATKYIPTIEGKDYINHIDGNKQNNEISNLEWCTMKENIRHARDTNLFREEHIPHNFGEDHYKSRLKECDVIAILKLRNKSSQEIAEKYNVSKSAIDHIFRGRSWTHLKRDPIDRHANGNKVNMEIAREIRQKHNEGMRQYKLAEYYQISKSVISRIITNSSWKENTI